MNQNSPAPAGLFFSPWPRQTPVYRSICIDNKRVFGKNLLKKELLLIVKIIDKHMNLQNNLLKMLIVMIGR